METRELTLSRKADVAWGETLIMPVGDLQLGTPESDTDRFRRHVEWGVEHGAYFIGMGDMVDVASPSNRRTLRSAGLYDSVMLSLEESAAQAVTAFTALVKGTEGRWLGLLEGHHYYQFEDGTTSDTRICQALGAPFLGNCAFVRLRMQRPNSRETLTCTLWAHHGAGGGASVGSPLLRLSNIALHFDADVYLMGHQHKVVAAPIDQLYMTHRGPRHIAHRTKLLVGTGSFLRGYHEGSRREGRAGGGYVEQRMLNPVALGAPIIWATPQRIPGAAYHRLDLRVGL